MILHLSSFKSDPEGNGAERRTAQIAELLSRTPHSITKVENPVAEHLYINLLTKLKTGWTYRDWLPVKQRSVKRLKDLGYQIERIHRFFRLLPVKPTLVIWEASRTSTPLLPVIMAELGLTVIVLPHNLESMCFGQSSLLSGAKQGNWLAEELGLLSHCTIGFAISREEQWLLNGNGLKTGFLPFFPAENHFARFRAIRQRRIQQPPENLVITIGSADNKPTAAGMISLMNLVASQKLKINLTVTGFNTTRLMNEPSASHPSVSITGTISNEELDELLIRCKAVVLYQEIAAGALTKIPELLLAGIPVIANETAARSWYNTPGVTVYRTPEEIPHILETVPEVVHEPQEPTDDYHFFIETVNRLTEKINPS